MDGHTKIDAIAQFLSAVFHYFYWTSRFLCWPSTLAHDRSLWIWPEKMNEPFKKQKKIKIPCTNVKRKIQYVICPRWLRRRSPYTVAMVIIFIYIFYPRGGSTVQSTVQNKLERENSRLERLRSERARRSNSALQSSALPRSVRAAQSPTTLSSPVVPTTTPISRDHLELYTR